MAEPVLKVEGYGKDFLLHEQKKSIPAARDVSFSVRAGTLTALVGGTGTGKSSVLKSVYRTYRPGRGVILYRAADGEEVNLALASERRILELRRREIGFVTQFLHCLPRKASLDIVAAPLVTLGTSLADAKERAAELLRAMALPERLWNVSPATFSGGERQRINLARGVIAEPRLLLLDEPTASLDPATAERVVELISALAAKGTALLAIFHDPAVTRRLADDIVELARADKAESPEENA
jgi:alpha-D-ribose 1-methylphosphonate 5-triphosphate synthase subunit PhnL